MQEGGMAQGAAVGQGRTALRGVENQLNPAVFDDIDDVEEYVMALRGSDED